MNDLVSRQAAIKWVKTECNPYGKPTLDSESGMKVIEHLAQMHAIDPVKHGKWLKIEGCNTVQCSECFDDFDYIDGLCYLCHGQELPNYCPNCGAMMEWSEE